MEHDILNLVRGLFTFKIAISHFLSQQARVYHRKCREVIAGIELLKILPAMSLQTVVDGGLFPDPAIPDMMRIKHVAKEVDRSVAHLIRMQADQPGESLITIPVVLK